MNAPIGGRRCALPLWYGAGLICVWMFALAFRFWGLARFNTFVFDEVYFAKFGYHYLTRTSFFDAHPPLGKYLIGLGIALKGFNPWGFRWVNALVGSLIPQIIAGIAYQLGKRPSFALIAAFLASLDGLLLVESRYALLNVHILFFGLLAHWLMLIALDVTGSQRYFWLGGAGVSFGATMAVKWNGLGFLLGFYGAWCVVRGVRRLQGEQRPLSRHSLPLQRLPELSLFQLFVYIPAIAYVVYRVLWIPHLAQNPDYSFWQLHRQILSYHQHVGGADIHPYCSSWYTWPLLLKPISYFYQLTQSPVESLPVIGPPLPLEAAHWVYSVYATGNPLLWWLSTFAIVYVLVQGIYHWQRYIQDPDCHPRWTGEPLWVPLYLGANYLANFMPWIGVSRCTFLYHYMPASIFSSLALAWLVDGWLQAPYEHGQRLAVTLLLVSLLGFMVCLPLFLGLPLSPLQWRFLQGIWG